MCLQSQFSVSAGLSQLFLDGSQPTICGGPSSGTGTSPSDVCYVYDQVQNVWDSAVASPMLEPRLGHSGVVWDREDPSGGYWFAGGIEEHG